MCFLYSFYLFEALNIALTMCTLKYEEFSYIACKDEDGLIPDPHENKIRA